MPNIDAPNSVKQLLDDFVQGFQSILGTNLVGIYLHGSLAMGSFNPASDVDLLIVVRDALTHDDKQRCRALLRQLAPHAPPKGIEMSIVTADSLTHFQHPALYEFHYPTDHADDGTELRDPDLAAHYTVTSARGITLLGTPIAAIFPAIPSRDYLDSIAADSAWSYGNIMQGPDDGSCAVPPYAVLNFCRVLAFIEQQSVLSKSEGGQWGLSHLPVQFHPIIHAALQKYSTNDVDADVDAALLKQFATYANTLIQRANSTPSHRE